MLDHFRSAIIVFYQLADPDTSPIRRGNQVIVKPKDRAHIFLHCADIYAFCGDKEQEKHHLKLSMSSISSMEIWQLARQAVVNRLDCYI